MTTLLARFIFLLAHKFANCCRVLMGGGMVFDTNLGGAINATRAGFWSADWGGRICTRYII